MYTINFEIGLDIIFIIDIFFTFFTGYYFEKRLETHLGRIAVNYIRNYFVIDCLTNIPMIATNYRINYFYYFKMIRLIKISNLFKNIEEIIIEVRLFNSVKSCVGNLKAL